MSESFLAFITHLQGQFPRKAPRAEPRDNSDNVIQLDFFRQESEILADRIAKIFVDLLLSAGADLSSLEIQVVVNLARKHIVDLLTPIPFRNSR
jgi:hypothetical protein